MTEDLSHIPRRLRRFYRHGVPVPEGYGPSATPVNMQAVRPAPQAKSNAPPRDEEADHDNMRMDGEDDHHEAWMNPKAELSKARPLQPAPAQPVKVVAEPPLSRGEQRRREREEKEMLEKKVPFVSPTTTPAQAPIPARNNEPPSGMFSKIVATAGSPPSTSARVINSALGLEKKELFEERLPRAGTEALARRSLPGTLPSSATENPAMVEALEQLKHLAVESKEEEKAPEKNAEAPPAKPSLTSFHFTPVATAPNPVANAPASTNAPLPPGLSPRDRMELRRAQQGQPPAASAAATPQQKPAAPAAAPVAASGTPHIRRRMGQREGMDEDAMSAPASKHEEMAEDVPLEKDEEELDFKSLMGKPSASAAQKKKKPKESSDDDEDFSLDEDLDGDFSLEDEK